ncbi:MAG: LarC family nickel insertion protein, partial [Ilumatobacteraceae bacterium]
MTERSTTGPRTAWFHCFAGTAGDMTLGALIDAGADQAAVAAIVGRLSIDGYALRFERVQRCGIGATHAVVAVDGHHVDEQGSGHRPYRVIRELLLGADLPARVLDRALRTFAALAAVEGAIHQVAPSDVEFHEVGSVDAIIDVVGSCAAFEVLGIDRIVCSPIAVGRGTFDAAHGLLPSPAPAVVGLLASRNAPAFGIDVGSEIATPTGVALMTALADGFGPLPAMSVEAVGHGAGTMDFPGRPNVVQVVIGSGTITVAAPTAGPGQPVRLLEVNV